MICLLAAPVDHWAFRDLRRPTIPSNNAENPIDAFISAKLANAGLALSSPAKPEQLIRRVSLDLIGLPPTPEEVDSFVHDQSPVAYQHLLDRLLASPLYGERWGRHWLDVARFAESDGFEHDAIRPHSWRYRDYVIESFNADKPFDRFIREQLAGDELWPTEPAALTATAFNLLGPDMVDSSDQMQRRHNTLNDMTDTLGLSFLGLTIGCARCHDHKFEPISQRDYYKLQAFFSSAKFERDLPIPSPAERAKYDRAMREYEARPAVRELTDFEAPFRKSILETKLAALSSEAQIAHRTPAAERTPEQANLVLETQGKITISEPEFVALLNPEQKEKHAALLLAVKRVPKPAPLPKSMGLRAGRPFATHILRRGEYSQPLEEVAPGIPSALERSLAGRNFKNRADLAAWIASPENPLTARVIVNRIWRHHFGRGLVATPSDFGTKGSAPSHPELLDFLASEFIGRGWSIKQMHQLMLTSAAYRQTTEPEPGQSHAAHIDPENKLYWRMNRLRLEGEPIRDSLLATSGRLNRQIGGPGVLPPIPKELFAGATGWAATEDEAQANRRSVYIFARRNLRFPFLEVFDAPDSNLSCPSREHSTSAPQSLTLLNSDEVLLAAKATSSRIEQQSASPDERINRAYNLILNRHPTDAERRISLQFLARAPLSELCRALYNHNDFVYTR